MNRYLLRVTGLLAILVGSASCANAATVQLTLVRDPVSVGCMGCTLSGTGKYQVFASTSLGDNQGIAGYAISIQNVTTVLHRSPRANVDDGAGNANPAGFTVLRSGNNQTSLGTGFLVGGGQDTITPTPYIITGLGQTASSFAAQLPAGATTLGTPTQPSWAAKLLLAEGTYPAGKTPFVDFNNIDAFVNVIFANGVGQAVCPAGEGVCYQSIIGNAPATIVPQVLDITPPATIPNLQLTASDDLTPAANLLWSGLQNSGPGKNVPGAADPSLDAAGHFTWNPTGWKAGQYLFSATVQDESLNATTGLALTVNVTVPEPSSIALGGLAVLGAATCFGRRRPSPVGRC